MESFEENSINPSASPRACPSNAHAPTATQICPLRRSTVRSRKRLGSCRGYVGVKKPFLRPSVFWKSVGAGQAVGVRSWKSTFRQAANGLVFFECRCFGFNTAVNPEEVGSLANLPCGKFNTSRWFSSRSHINLDSHCYLQRNSPTQCPKTLCTVCQHQGIERHAFGLGAQS